jgi:predicted nucleic acid-binding protein
MGTRFLLDTNTVIYLCNGGFPVNAVNFLSKEVQKGISLSIISEIELLGWNAQSEQETAILESFVAGSDVIQLTRPIVLKTIEIRKLRKIKLPDAIIAATAIVHNLTLISRNDSDFKKIEGLDYLNPFTDL